MTADSDAFDTDTVSDLVDNDLADTMEDLVDADAPIRCEDGVAVTAQRFLHGMEPVARAAARDGRAPVTVDPIIGFRLARSAP